MKSQMNSANVGQIFSVSMILILLAECFSLQLNNSRYGHKFCNCFAFYQIMPPNIFNEQSSELPKGIPGDTCKSPTKK